MVGDRYIDCVAFIALQGYSELSRIFCHGGTHWNTRDKNLIGLLLFIIRSAAHYYGASGGLDSIAECHLVATNYRGIFIAKFKVVERIVSIFAHVDTGACASIFHQRWE